MIANSIPKSGTHLLTQALEVLPAIHDWGNFFASTPSFTMREIEALRMAQRIRGLARNELVSGHMFYALEVHEAIKEKSAVHYFIYRDPRDVLVSKVKYLTSMNRWHRLHRVFKRMRTDEERLLFSIRGDENRELPF